MTELKANEIFRTKYPNGEIVRKNASSAGYKYFVVFNHGGKAYYYSNTSYAELLRRLGFNVVYKHDVATAENCVTRYTQQLEDLNNGIKPVFFNLFGDKTDEKAMADEIADTERQLNEWKEILRHYTEDCIID